LIISSRDSQISLARATDCVLAVRWQEIFSTIAIYISLDLVNNTILIQALDIALVEKKKQDETRKQLEKGIKQLSA